MELKIGILTKDFVVKSKDPKHMYLPTGGFSYVSHTRKCQISPRSVITNVFHIPEFKYTLLLVRKVTKELKCSITFFPHFCVFQELYTVKAREVSKKDDGLYRCLRT